MGPQGYFLSFSFSLFGNCHEILGCTGFPILIPRLSHFCLCRIFVEEVHVCSRLILIWYVSFFTHGFLSFFVHLALFIRRNKENLALARTKFLYAFTAAPSRHVPPWALAIQGDQTRLNVWIRGWIVDRPWLATPVQVRTCTPLLPAWFLAQIWGAHVLSPYAAQSDIVVCNLFSISSLFRLQPESTSHDPQHESGNTIFDLFFWTKSSIFSSEAIKKHLDFPRLVYMFYFFLLMWI